MLKNISGTVCLILTAILLMLFPACVSKGGLSEKNGLNAQEEIKTVKIAYLPITHAVPLYIENELSNGKFRHFSLELVKFGSWTELAEALNAGKVDGALMLIELAVKGMLPKNSLGRAMFRKLKVYRGPEHVHQAQKPEVLEINV